jgi:acetyl esterase/lipase
MVQSGSVPLFQDVEPDRRIRGDLLDIYVPEGSAAGRRPAVIFVHGGPVRWSTPIASSCGSLRRRCARCVLAARCAADWAGDGPRFDAVAAVSAHPALPKLLVRVGDEYEFFARTQDAFVKTAHDAGAMLDVIEIAHASHGFDGRAYDAASRDAVDQAMNWVVSTLAG